MLLLVKPGLGVEPADSHTYIDMPLSTIVSDGVTDDTAAWKAWRDTVMGPYPTGGADPHHKIVLRMPDNSATGGMCIADGIGIPLAYKNVEVAGPSPANPFKLITNTISQQNATFNVTGTGNGVRNLFVTGALGSHTHIGTDGHLYAVYWSKLYDKDAAFQFGNNALNCYIEDCGATMTQSDGVTAGFGGGGKPGARNCRVVRFNGTYNGRCGAGVVNATGLYFEDCKFLWSANQSIDLERDSKDDALSGIVIKGTSLGAAQMSASGYAISSVGAAPVDDLVVDTVEFVSNDGSPIGILIAGPGNVRNGFNMNYPVKKLWFKNNKLDWNPGSNYFAVLNKALDMQWANNDFGGMSHVPLKVTNTDVAPTGNTDNRYDWFAGDQY